MKKYIGLMLLLCSAFMTRAQYVSIPDDAFKTFLMSRYPACFNASGEMDTTCTDIVTEDSLTFGNSGSGNNYAALAYFDGLTYLNLNHINISNAANFPVRLPAGLIKVIFSYVNRYITSYPEVLIGALPSGVQYIDYSYCNLGSLNGKTWPASLKYLDLTRNYLTGDLGVLPNTLDTLILRQQNDNPGFGSTLSSITTALPTGLTYLDFGSNSIFSFPTLPAGLKYLDCSNQFYYVGLSMMVPVPGLTYVPTLPAGLVTLKCHANRITSLPALPSTLEYLHCGGNKFYLNNNHSGIFDYPGISTLPALPASLKYLNCGTNALTFLPTFPASLQFLNVNDNLGLTSVPPLPDALNYLNCGRTAVTCVGTLPAAMVGPSLYNTTGYNLETVSSNINCIPNFVPGILIHASSTLPLCNVNNNTNACSINPVIAGNVFYDNNSNGVQDPGENPRENVRVLHNGTAYAHTDLNGHYEVTGVFGNNSITIEAPPFYAAVPASVSHTVTLPNSLVTDQIALQPIATVDSLWISILALQNPRINGTHSFHIDMKNVGTMALNTQVTIQYDNNNLTYLSSSNPLVVAAGPGTLILPAGTLNPGHGTPFNLYFQVNTTASLGTHLLTRAQISGGSSVAYDSAQSVIIGPLDPNDKDATPILTQTDVTDGKYINYLVRFQNVGTASAIDVFIQDTLSAMLDENSLQMLEVSHPCTITQIGKNLSFVFQQINLPDSNTNEAASHGFIRFRVKPMATLSAGNTVLNKASIYFDFNAPVVTNEAKTTIVSGPVPLTLLYFKGSVQPGDKAALQWATARETNTSVFELEASADGNQFDKIAVIRAIGTGDHVYNKEVLMQEPLMYYRLRMVDMDGRFSYSRIIRLQNEKPSAAFVVLNNPAQSELKIRLMATELFRTPATLYDGRGNFVRTFVLTDHTVVIPVNDLPTGVYILRTVLGSQKVFISR